MIKPGCCHKHPWISAVEKERLPLGLFREAGCTSKDKEGAL